MWETVKRRINEGPAILRNSLVNSFAKQIIYSIYIYMHTHIYTYTQTHKFIFLPTFDFSFLLVCDQSLEHFTNFRTPEMNLPDFNIHVF